MLKPKAPPPAPPSPPALNRFARQVISTQSTI